MEPLHIAKIIRTGTSHAVVIPVNIMAGLGWLRGDHVVLTFAHGDQLVMHKLTDEQVRLLKQRPYTVSSDGPEELQTIE